MSSGTRARLLQSSTFRLALIYMAIFSSSVLLLLAFIYGSTAGYIVHQTESTIEAESFELVENYQLAGVAGLKGTIRARLARASSQSAFYLLVDGQFKPILGNLRQWPQGELTQQGWLRFRIEAEDGAESEARQALAKVFQLDDGLHLLVGRDTHDLEATKRLIREALFWGMVITFVLGLVGGAMMSRAMMHRIEMINTTCQKIMGGELSRRIPRSGREDDIDKLVDNLNLMLDQIEKLMHGVRQVTNNIAHDLRTPLAHLRRRLEMLRGDPPTNTKYQDLLDQAIEEADGLLATFRALLRISEVESGSRRGEFKNLDMAELLNDLSEFYKPLSEERGQEFLTDVGEAQPIQGDRDLLFQAFANLLDNAVKYTPAGGRIIMQVEDHPDRLEVLIKDTGRGIPREARGKVFERFYRLEESRTTPGNGLGLSLVAAIVKLHHGLIDLRDNCPGLVATVTLPRV